MHIFVICFTTVDSLRHDDSVRRAFHGKHDDSIIRTRIIHVVRAYPLCTVVTIAVLGTRSTFTWTDHRVECRRLRRSAAPRGPKINHWRYPPSLSTYKLHDFCLDRRTYFPFRPVILDFYRLIWPRVGPPLSNGSFTIFFFKYIVTIGRTVRGNTFESTPRQLIETP